MSEVKKCLKCGGEMQKGNLVVPIDGRFIKFTDRVSEPSWAMPKMEKVDAFACKSCGYIEIYKEMNKP
jgi:predicted nucleic-acid-binding Zn-ribbon protein